MAAVFMGLVPPVAHSGAGVPGMPGVVMGVGMGSCTAMGRGMARGGPRMPAFPLWRMVVFMFPVYVRHLVLLMTWIFVPTADRRLRTAHCSLLTAFNIPSRIH